MWQDPFELCHSAKGSTWKNHKYIRKQDGRYYYSSKEYADEYRSNTGHSAPVTNKNTITKIQYTPGNQKKVNKSVSNNTAGTKPYTPGNQKKVNKSVSNNTSGTTPYSPGYKNPKKNSVTNNTKGTKPYTPTNQKKTSKVSTANASTAGPVTNKASVSKRQYTPSPSIKKTQTTSYGVAKARKEYYDKDPVKKATNTVKNQVIKTASSVANTVKKKVSSAIDKVKNTALTTTRKVNSVNGTDPNLDKKKGKTKTKKYSK